MTEQELRDCTEQELRGCPHCGSKPVRKAYVTPSSPCGPAEYDEEIYCDNEECKQLYMDDIVAHWNTRAYDAEREELKAKRGKLINAILDKLKREYKDYMLQRDDLREKSIGIKILNEVIVQNYQTQILIEGIAKLEELLK
jgi:hypothetical protein